MIFPVDPMELTFKNPMEVSNLQHDIDGQYNRIIYFHTTDHIAKYDDVVIHYSNRIVKYEVEEILDIVDSVRKIKAIEKEIMFEK